MQIQQIQLVNFQSHVNCVVSLNPGFTCIVGKSRSGKSAVVRALNFIFNDEWYDSYVRNGADSAIVSVLFDNGTRVERQKGTNINRITLTINGQVQVFDKFGVEAPPAVKQVLQMRPVKLDADAEVLINIAGQDDMPFLLAESGAMKTKYLNRLTGLHIIDTALKDLNKDKLRQSTQKQESLLRVGTLEEQKRLYENIPKLSTDILNLQVKVTKVDALVNRLDNLYMLRARLNKVQANLQYIKKYATGLSLILEKHDQAVILVKRYVYLKNIQANLLKITLKKNTLNLLSNYLDRYFPQITTAISVMTAVQSYKKILVITRKKIQSKVLSGWIDKQLINLSQYSLDLLKLEKYKKLNELSLRQQTVFVELNTVQTALAKFTACPLCNSPLRELQGTPGYA